MPAPAEVEIPVRNDSESVDNQDYAHCDARANVTGIGSVLDLTPAHAEYVHKLKSIIEREAPLEQVLNWDRTKTPPLPVLRAMVDEGCFVSGVPIAEWSL